ncbi:response regulator [Aquabacter spiritensis]|uniref:Two-component system chemotaxis response regulator CheY n=1 Tax=Aquabacter spiritensis TaxID=933073 RepID=A0A4R3M3W9_9HYPH|nr:response regulator [Aquabacter spiritensis]TCT07961.1 two-component system chemotaxis response regulator CheY [Aquabacter spiritensis]
MKTCLIVDDSRVVRMVARRFFEGWGFDTREAADGAEALDACAIAMPDVILLDWNMPRMTGIEVLRQLRSWPRGTTPKVIFCTTQTDPAHIAAAIKAGADEYIMKPFDAEILERKLVEVGLIATVDA